MSIQINDFRLSLHTDAMIADEMFHVRIVTSDDKIRPLLDAIVRLQELSESDFIAFGRYKVGEYTFEVMEGEAHDGVAAWAFGNVVELSGFYWNFERRNGQIYLDFNIEKDFGADEWLDRTKDRSGSLPMTFWVEPASVIRSIMRRN